eukprot:5637473-Amphidinium_carterae.1
MSQMCTRQAIYDSVGIVALVMRRMLPSHEFSRMGIAKDMLRMLQYALNTFAAQWCEGFLNKLSVAIKVGSLLEPRELHHVLHTALDPVLKDLDVALTWQDTSREVKVRSSQFCVEDVQTLGSTMLVELRMRDDGQRNKQLVVHSSPSRPQAAAQSYEAEQKEQFRERHHNMISLRIAHTLH